MLPMHSDFPTELFIIHSAAHKCLRTLGKKNGARPSLDKAARAFVHERGILATQASD